MTYTRPDEVHTKRPFSMQEERDLFEGYMASKGIKLRRMGGAEAYYDNHGDRMAWAGWLARARLNNER